MVDGEGGMDALGDEAQQCGVSGVGLSSDLIGESAEPEEPVEEATSVEGEVGEGLEALHRVADVLHQGLEVFLEGQQQAVASVESGAQQGLGDEQAFILPGDVADDAEQVAGVRAVGKSARLALALEGGDAVEDVVEGIASDSSAVVSVGVREGETGKGLVEEAALDRVLASLESLASELLLPAALLEGGASLLDLLGGRRLGGVDFDAGAPLAVLARPMIEGPSPSLHDEHQDLAGHLLGGGGGDDDQGHDLGEETKGALDVRLVLRSPLGGLHPDGGADPLVDLGAEVGGAVVDQNAERLRAGGPHAVVEGFDDRLAVLLVVGGDPDGSVAVRIDHQLEVEAEALCANLDIDGRAVADPLGAGEESLEVLAQGLLVGRAAGTSVRGALAALCEEGADERVAVGDAEVEADMFAEGAEAALPAVPLVEDGLDAGAGRRIRLGPDGVVRLGRLVSVLSSSSEPVLERTQRHAD